MGSIKCTNCRLVNWATAEVCKRCGIALAGNAMSSMALSGVDNHFFQPEPAFASDSTFQLAPAFEPLTAPLYFPVSTTKLIVMSVCSFGLYESYWFYKHWKQIKDNSGATSLGVSFILCLYLLQYLPGDN